MKTIRISLAVLALTLLSVQVTVGQEISQELRSFNKIIASPKINVILEKGDQESIRLVYSNISADKINITVKHHTLRIYLDDARITEKQHPAPHRGKQSEYQDASVTAYITYNDLEHLEIRGEQELTCNGPIDSKKFTLKAYGENEIRLTSVKTEYLKTSLYGENSLKIRGGKAEFQKYRLFGENRIDTQALKSYSVTANSYGESRIRLNTQDQLRVNAFGESQISYNGNASINRGLIFGRTQINRFD